MRTKLFLSYSRGDANWRNLFWRHLKSTFKVGEELWVDLASLEGGEGWSEQITQAARDSHSALVLVTPNYLEKGCFARSELDLLAEQQKDGLKLLLVLAEECAWQDVPTLAEGQFLRWHNSTVQVAVTGGTREVVRPLREAGNDFEIDRAVLEVCEQVRKHLGVVAQTTDAQRDDLLQMTKEILAPLNVQIQDAVHSGDFSVVYRGRWQSEEVAVKVVPDAARRNRVRDFFDSVLTKLEELRDTAFIQVKYHDTNREPHVVVMEYVEWPTLETRLSEYPQRRLQAPVVAKMLSTLARAQGVAHRAGVQIGPLSPANIHVSDEWEIRISPLRIEGQLARASGLTSGQLMNWDVLTTITPEIASGLSPSTPEELDKHEQYYLGLLGLELLVGHRPFEMRRFDDFKIKEQFFDNPRSFFGYEDTDHQWMNTDPAMAFVLGTLLARDPQQRYESADAASIELAAIVNGALPASARRCLENDMDVVASETFSQQFYSRLFRLRPTLEGRFTNPHAQAKALSEAIQDLVEYRADATRSRFLSLARRHADYRLATDDIDAFQRAFVEEIIESSPGGRVSGDAWKAALMMGLTVMSELANQGQAVDRQST